MENKEISLKKCCKLACNNDIFLKIKKFHRKITGKFNHQCNSECTRTGKKIHANKIYEILPGTTKFYVKNETGIHFIMKKKFH
jgi:hypothetical protein